MTKKNKAKTTDAASSTGNFEAVMLNGGDTVELRIYTEIGDSIFSAGVSANRISETLQQSPNARVINVRMSSPGGSVWEGMAIRSMLAAHPARVEVDIEGLCASAATLVAMAGDVIRMHTGSSMMIHEGTRMTRGDLREHQRSVAMLEAINNGAASLYAQRSGKSTEDILALMAAETWLTPEAAKQLGLCDEIVPGKVAVPAMTFDLTHFGYRNVPPHIAAVSMQLAQPSAATTQQPDPTTREPAGEPPLETHDMSYKHIAMALGVTTGEGSDEETAVLSAVHKLRQQLSASEAFMADLRAATGRTSNEELLGAVRGLNETAAQAAQLRSRIDELEKATQDAARAQLIAADAADPKGRKLTPATAKFFDGRPVAELKAFLEAAPHILPTSTDNAQPGVVSSASGDNPPNQATQWNGKTWATMNAVEKHNLFVENREVYDQLLADHRQRRGISAA